MTFAGWIEISLVLALVLGAAWPLGASMADVFEADEAFFRRWSDRSNEASTGYRASTPKRSKTGSIIQFP